MKKFITFLLAAASAFTIHAQQEAPPQGINYQAVALDNSEKETVGVDVTAQPVAEKDIRVRFSILKTSENGPLTYREQHIVTTDIYGLFNAVIGQGTVDSSPIDFSQIDWGTGYHFLKVEIDITGGTNYKDMGTQQLWSVPYALYSKYASVAGNGIDSVTDNGNGTITFTYIDGSTYTTPTLTGLTGPQGEIGPQGPAGTDGQNGLSAYEIWLSQGNTGTESDFLNSLVGAQGIQGPIGAAGPQGPQGVQGIAGTNGLDGNGITSTIDNGNGTFTINYSNGTSFTTSNLTGPQGIQGPIGAVGPQGVQGVQGIAGTNGLDGNGITSTIDNGNGTFTLNYSNGTSFTTSNLTGPQGIQGPIGAAGPQGPQGVQGIAGTNGLDGNGITSTIDNGNGTFTINYSNGTSFTTSNLTGPQGIQGPIGATGPQGSQGLPGTNGQSINWQGTMSNPLPSPNINDAYYNTTDGTAYVWNGTIWVVMYIDNDGDPTNEIQQLSVSNDSLILSESNSVPLSSLIPSNISGQHWQQFTTSSNFIVPEGVTSLMVEIIGAGGGGARYSTNTGNGGAGGSGAYGKTIITVTPGEVIPVTIGAGGIRYTGASSSGGDGSPGGNTTFGTYIIATGGGGGLSTSVGGVPGTCNTPIFIQGQQCANNSTGCPPRFYYNSFGIGGRGAGVSNGTPGNGTSGLVIVYW